MQSITPNTVNQILEMKYGDCKDISLLLVCLLREIGFEAYYTLALADQYHGNTDQIIVSQFNHAVVLIKKDNRDFWIDATSDYGCTGEPPFLIIGKYALIIDETKSYLQLINSSTPSAFKMNITVDSFIENGIKGKLSCVFVGHYGDSFRAYETYQSKSSFYIMLQKALKTIVKGDIDYSDITYDSRNNIFQINALYTYNNVMMFVNDKNYLLLKKIVHDYFDNFYVADIKNLSTHEMPFDILFPRGMLSLDLNKTLLQSETIYFCDDALNSWIRSETDERVTFHYSYDFIKLPLGQSEEDRKLINNLSHDLCITKK